MDILHTERVVLRHLILDDAPFILELLNDPAFLRNIGDRQVRDLDQARQYLQDGPLASYQQHGFGLFLAQLKDDDTPIGICGLLKRPTLPDVDVGFALLPTFCGRGYASEAAAATLDWGRQQHGLKRIVAITSPDNHASARVLEKIGLVDDGLLTLDGEATPVRLFVTA